MFYSLVLFNLFYYIKCIFIFLNENNVEKVVLNLLYIIEELFSKVRKLK